MMKKQPIIISALFFFLFLVVLNSNAQKPFATYHNTYCDKEFDILVSSSGNGVFTLWINAMSFDELSHPGGMIIRERNYSKFIDDIKQAKQKYEEYVKEVKVKNIKKLDKTMRIFNSVDVYFKQENLFQQHDVLLNFDFKVRENDGKINYLLFVSSGEITASNNISVKSMGYGLVFTSTDEIDSFIDKLSLQKIDDFIIRTDTIGFLTKLRKSDGSWHPKSKNGFFSRASFGIKAGYNTYLGMNNANTQNTNEYSLNNATTDIIGGTNVGVFGRIDFNKFYFQPELLYCAGHINYKISALDNHLEEIKFNKTSNISTIDIPLVVGYKLLDTKKTNIRLFVGPKLRINLGSSLDYTYFNTFGTVKAIDLTSIINTTKLGLEIGLGYDFSSFMIDVHYNFIQDMYHTQLYSHTIDNLSANNLTISVGWKLFRPKE